MLARPLSHPTLTSVSSAAYAITDQFSSSSIAYQAYLHHTFILLLIERSDITVTIETHCATVDMHLYI